MYNSAELVETRLSMFFVLQTVIRPGSGFSADATKAVTSSSIFHTRPDKAISLCDFYRKKCFLEALV